MISTFSEYRSERAFSRLFESCGAEKCRVRRAGAIYEIDVTEIVVGDVVLLGAGEKIPADGVVLSGFFTVDQSPLTGESREVEKCPYKRGEPEAVDSAGAVFAGSALLGGAGEMLVTRVGDATFLGGISGELQEEKRESPLKARLTRLAAQISRIGYVMAAVCAIAFLCNAVVIDAGFDGAKILDTLRNFPLMAELLLRALTLALTVVVVAVPEGLPMMIAVVLSANIRRMVRDQVLVRKPEGLEAAGSMNILFTDKTGTLTAGKLTPCGVLCGEGEYDTLRQMARMAPTLYNTTRLAVYATTGAVRGEREGRPCALGGNATDRALLEPFLEGEEPPFGVRERIPFDSERKWAASETEEGTVFFCGAPDKLLPFVRSYLDGTGNEQALASVAFRAKINARAAHGERVLLLCVGDALPQSGGFGALRLLCALCFCDPLRPDARRSVCTLQRAGVQVVMLTGDSRETACAMARGCGILHEKGVVLSGEELARLSDGELCALLPRLAVVARALPSDKSRLVRLCEREGLVVGMTGDGINDAPALSRADVGFAMGSGTQVAREAGDVVILDDTLSSITRAVLYGRTIFKSIRKFIALQLMMNFCAVGISILGPFLGIDAPVTVTQMLWINLVMDTLGGLAFAGEAPMPFYLQEPPKRREEQILTRALVARIAVLTLFTVGSFVFFLKSAWVRSFYRESEGDLCLLTAFFALFIFASVFNCFNARTDRVRMLLGLAQNRAFLFIMAAVAAVQIAFVYLGGTVLRTMPLTPRELLFTLLLAATVLPVGWLHLLHRRLCGKKGLY
jgi:calcium-translocating P-type ATPase